MSRAHEEVNYYYNIDFLRFVFAIIIVYYHIFHSNIMNYVNGNEVYNNLRRLCGYAGAIVECFFIISGFFLFHSFRKKDMASVTQFSIKKIFRLWPVLAFSILIGCLFFNQSKTAAVFDLLFLKSFVFPPQFLIFIYFNHKIFYNFMCIFNTSSTF